MRYRRCISALFLAMTFASCGSRNTEVVFYVVDGYRFSWTDRWAIERIIDATAAEVRQLLPALPPRLTLRVRAGKTDDVMAETGASGEASVPDVVYWTVDPNRPEGVRGIVDSHLRQTLFHEFHHLVRGAIAGEGRTLVEQSIDEGLATAFERDFAHGAVPWGMYPDDVAAWVDELRVLPAGAPRSPWFSRNPDGRRWIGYKVGTYLVDRAMKASGRSAAALVSVPTEEILRMASTP